MIKHIIGIFVALLFVLTPFAALAQNQLPSGVSETTQYKPLDLNVVRQQMQQLHTNAPYLVQIFSSGTITNPQTQQSGKAYYSGSGFVFEDDEKRCGIITNSHVLGPQIKATAWVRFEGQKLAQQLRIISRDRAPIIDIALLKCPSPLPQGVRSAKLASSIEVGQTAYAIGFPHNVRSVTFGVINATKAPFSPFNFINQTPLQPGNSGGPLIGFNKQGEDVVIGMNIAMSIQGLQSHTVDIKYIKRLLPWLWEEEKEIIHASFGVTVAEISGINPDFFQNITNKRYDSLKEEQGLIIVQVTPGSSAGTAGIEIGDFILGLLYNGEEIIFENVQELFVELLLHFRPGDEVTIKTKRDGEIHERKVILGEYQIPR